MIKVVLTFTISAITLMVLSYISIRANRRFRHMDRLPMQWSLGGDVNWTAPRRIALAFTPILAIFVLTGAVLSTAFLDPHPGQEGFEVPAVFVLSLSLIGVHLLHIWLIQKGTNKNGG